LRSKAFLAGIAGRAGPLIELPRQRQEIAGNAQAIPENSKKRSRFFETRKSKKCLAALF